jgi:protein DGCR14
MHARTHARTHVRVHAHTRTQRTLPNKTGRAIPCLLSLAQVPFLRARDELDKAVQSRDPVRVQEAHANLRRCAMTPGGGSLRTPRRGTDGVSVPGTPAHGSRGATPASEFGGSSVCGTQDEELDHAEEVRRLTKGKRLDQFLHKFTSEDNQSASQLLLDDSVRFEQSRMWIHDQALEFNTKQKKLLENGPRQEDGTLNMVLSAKYDESQALMSYAPKSEVAPKEVVSRVGAVKEVNISGTRMDKSMLERLHKAGMASGVLAAAARGHPGFVGVTGRLQGDASPAHGGGANGLPPSVPASPRVGGYGFLVTPSPAPGVDDDAPMFTWGAVDGTPLLLHEDDPMPGYQPFKVQAKTEREELAERMYKRTVKRKDARGEFREVRQESRAASLTPGPALGGISKGRVSRGATPRMGGARAPTPVLSEAARRLAAKVGLGPKDSVDKQLRASYRGTTPRHSGAHTPASVVGGTPRRSTAALAGGSTPRMPSQSPAPHQERASASAGAGRGEHAHGAAAKSSAHLTDGLLQL